MIKSKQWKIIIKVQKHKVIMLVLKKQWIAFYKVYKKILKENFLMQRLGFCICGGKNKMKFKEIF